MLSVGSYKDIELSDKYQTVFNKIEKKTLAVVDTLKSKLTEYQDEVDFYNNVKNAFKSLKRSYVSFKRKALYGTMTSEDYNSISDTFSAIQSALIASDQNDIRLKQIGRRMANINLDNLVNQYQSSTDENRLTLLQNNDSIQNIFDEADSALNKSISKYQTLINNQNKKIERHETLANNSLYKIKNDFVKVESYEAEASNTLAQLNITV